MFARYRSALATSLTALLLSSPSVPAAEPGPEKHDRIPGIVVDDSQAEFTGKWVASNKQIPIVGTTYSHDNNVDRGTKTAARPGSSS